MNRRVFMRAIGGGVAAVLGITLIPKKDKDAINDEYMAMMRGLGFGRSKKVEPRWLCTEKHVRYHWGDRQVSDCVIIDDVPNPKFFGGEIFRRAIGDLRADPVAMEKLLAYVDEPRNRLLDEVAARLIKKPRNPVRG